jgi:hypothetical protein
MQVMAKKKLNIERRQRRMMLPVSEELHEQLKLLATKNLRPLNLEVHRILTEELSRSGLWPPKKK